MKFYKEKKVVILGDLNINLLLQNPQVELFCLELRSRAYIPYITKPTRFPPQNANINPSHLDHIWCNCFLNCRAGIFTLLLSDHLPCFLRIPINKVESNKKLKLSFRSHNYPANIARFRESLSNNNWNTVLTGDANEKYFVFDLTLNQLYCQGFQEKIKYISVKRMNNSWILSDDLRGRNIQDIITD